MFSSPYYRDVTTKDKSAYSLMKKIVMWYDVFYQRCHIRNDLALMQDIVNEFKRESNVPRSVVKALQEIVDVASNCGQNVGFDFHKKNFGVNEYGTLIFRDPIYVRG